ncbi:uncharacterized protein LOC141829837 [Curcuma longa]|uniref:uncharacterized protein LOC141829837 n=1 Tax=Curcuma longa TaxID=136217 RepID=UPI003D9E1F15
MANAKEVKLYGTAPSPFCLMVHHALRLKGVPYDYVEEDLKNKSQELLRLNPVYKKVPVLVVDGRPVAESCFILQYIDEQWASLGPRLLPEDPYRRAKVRFWADFIYQKVAPLTYVIPKAEGDSKAAAAAEFRAHLVAMEAGVREELWDGAALFVNGDSPGLLDLLVGVLYSGTKFLEGAAGVQLLDKEETPLLYSVMEAFLQLDVVKETTDFLQQHVDEDLNCRANPSMATAKEVKLYGTAPSSYCLMVHHALRLKGVPYDYVEEDLKNKSQDLLRLNPVYKKVPVLVVDGRPVAESCFILQYIDEQWVSLGPRLLPEDPYRRAKVRFWADFVYQKVAPLTYVIPKAEGDSKAAAAAEFRAHLVAMEAGVREELWDGAALFVNGDSPGLLDLLVGVLYSGTKFLEGAAGVQLLDKEETPLLYSVMEAFLQLDVVKETTDFLQQHVDEDR